MSEIDKIIKGLECMKRNSRPTDEECNSCGYYNSSDCGIDVSNDVLKLLKDNEPRVLLLEEALGAEDTVYFESDGNACFWVGLDYGDNIFDGSIAVYRMYASTMYFHEKTYGKTWRCWSGKPTEEQRKATKWN